MKHAAAASPGIEFSRFEQVRMGREIVRAEADALTELASRLGNEFGEAIDLLFACQGSVIVSGMGKAGLIGQKIVATLASTGTRSHFLHPGEAIHGDLGRVHHNDVLLMLSFSGETEEITRLLPSLHEIPLVAITGKPESSLGRAADVVLDLGPMREACTLGLAPSTSTTAMLAIGDALALVMSEMRGFGPQDFVRFHPGGSLGRKLAVVDEVMRPLTDCRLTNDAKSVRQMLIDASRPGRRSGAVMLTDSEGRLSGIFTDSDLARLLEVHQDQYLDHPVSEVMSVSPTTIATGTMMTDAVNVMVQRKISELPVVDSAARPVGMLDITDVVAWLPRKSDDEAEPATVKIS